MAGSRSAIHGVPMSTLPGTCDQTGTVNRASTPAHSTSGKRGRTWSAKEAHFFKRLDEVSPTIEGTCTTESQMRFWLDWLHRFHADSSIGSPVAFKTVDCPVIGADGEPRIDATGRRVRMRCVLEIASYKKSEPAPWVVITWEIAAAPGVRFKDCGSLDEAISIFSQPPAAVTRP